MKIFVDTPKGKKLHGSIVEKGKNKYFVRVVNYDRDRMRMFDAWSLHPTAYEQIKQAGVTHLLYLDKENKKSYTLELEKVESYLSGEVRSIASGNKFAWYAEFSGGETIYIKLSGFELRDIKGKESNAN